jgi:uncharacterized protein (TIGR00730 family)
MKTICVFCGSSIGARPEYLKAANALGISLLNRKIRLVYGGSRIGIMGHIASTMLENGGQVIGVIPRELVKREVAHKNLTELHITETMHERKAIMSELSDGFIALPGGLGTLEEILEMLTWAQLGIHNKPCGLLNVVDFFNGLLTFLDHSVKEHFIESVNLSMLLVDKDPDSLLSKFMSYKAPQVDMVKWALEHQSII